MRPHARVLFAGALLLFASMPVCAQSVCGNGVREPGEQCDDGNTQNGDGCSAQCLFEQNQRVNQFKMQFATSPTCTADTLGTAIPNSTVQSQLQTSIDNGVADGSTSILFAMLGLDDLTGTSDSAVQVGILQGTPAQPAPGFTYNGTNDLDWWYSPNPADLDASRLPLSKLNGAIAANVLTAGPGSANVNFVFGGSPAPLYMTSLRITATNGAANVPTPAAGSYPPGHLASEHLDPTLTSYATSGASITGEMCGNVRAASLAAIPVPASLAVGGGTTACSQGYSSTWPTNSMLDVYVHGCTILLFIQAVQPTQPDQVDTDAPPAGGGPPYIFTLTGNHVTGCTASGSNAALTDCLNAAAYSSYFKFSTDRVIEKPCPPDAPVAANDGPACEGGTLHLTATGPSGDYSWTGPNGFTSTQQNPVIANVTAADAGTYSVTVTLGGCTSPAGTTNVTVNPTPATPVITAPATAPPGMSGFTASVALHTGSTYAWTITNGFISAGQGTNQITFSTNTLGTLTLGVTETNNSCTSAAATASVSVELGIPQNVVATGQGSTQVLITWLPVPNAAGYEIDRQPYYLGSPVVGRTTTTTQFIDVNVFPNSAYLYTVRATDQVQNAAGASAPDLATTVVFTDDPLAAGTTIVKMVHVNELRTAVNAVRALTPLGAFGFTDPTLTTDTPVKAIHVSELRTALDEARANLGLPALAYTDPTLTPGTTMIKAAHLQEIREGVK